MGTLRIVFLHGLAYVWRRLLFRTTFIAITGSVGKTTAKECLAAVLATQHPTVATRYNQNDRRGVPRTLLRVRPWHRFAVIEIAMVERGLVRRSARLVRPHVAIVLAVARTHTRAYASLDQIAAEKAALLDALPPDGLAILNADDPRVHAMAAGRGCRILTFGRSPDCDVRADRVSAAFPERLAFRAHTDGDEAWVHTRLVGAHWVNSALAALAGGHACGVPLATAAAALARVEPAPARMQPVALPNGAVVIRDELNGSFDTWDAAADVLTDAKAGRRVVIASDLIDWPGRPPRPRDRNRELGRMVARIADVAVFVSEHSRHAVRSAVAAGMPPDSAHGFTSLAPAAALLKAELRAGDVVLLKGRVSDHLSRLCFAQLGEIGCWKERCPRRIVCDHCEALRPGFDLRLVGGGAPPGRASAGDA